MFLGYSLKTKAYRCINYRNKTIIESDNVKVDEKFGIQERILDYDSDEETNPKIGRVIIKTDNDLQNGYQIEDQISKPSTKERVELTNPSKSISKYHPPKTIIGKKDKRVMTRNRVNEEICLISQA